jgi:hypothetical protein
MVDRRRLVRTPGHSRRAARAAGTEQKRARSLMQDASGAEQQKIARA